MIIQGVFAKILFIGRPKRAAQAGYIYHVLNRANARMTIFETDEDFAAFERILSEAIARFELRLLSLEIGVQSGPTLGERLARKMDPS